MHAVVRRYTGVSSLVRHGVALTTITVCEDSAGTETSTGRAAEWVRDDLPDLTASPPEISERDVFLAFPTH